VKKEEKERTRRSQRNLGRRRGQRNKKRRRKENMIEKKEGEGR
jgi:hypothetical protein